MYLLMFTSGIMLRHKMPKAERPVRVGKGSGLIWFIAGVGFCGALLAFILSFIPPSQISTGSNAVWFSVLIIGCVVVVVAPFIIYASRKPSWQDPEAAKEFQPFHWEKGAQDVQPAAVPAGTSSAGVPVTPTATGTAPSGAASAAKPVSPTATGSTATNQSENDKKS